MALVRAALLLGLAVSVAEHTKSRDTCRATSFSRAQANNACEVNGRNGKYSAGRDHRETLLGEPGLASFAGPFTKITVKPNNDLAAMMPNSGFYVSMRVKTGTTIGENWNDLLLIGSSDSASPSWCSGLYFYMKPTSLGVGHQVSAYLAMRVHADILNAV